MMMKRLAALILTLCMLLGCMAIARAESTDNPLLFTVNGREYFLSDVQPIYDYYIEMYSYYGYDMTSAENQRIIRAFCRERFSPEAVCRSLTELYGEITGVTP